MYRIVVANSIYNNKHTSTSYSTVYKTIQNFTPYLACGRSILFTTTIALIPFSKAFLKTNRVWGFGPSTESTTNSTASTIFIIRSTSPPKSRIYYACIVY